MERSDIEAFVEWFQSNGGFLDTQAMGVTEFPGSGRGVIALRDIPEGYTLFTLPRTLTLSTRTSPLPTLFGSEAWRMHGLHKGWVGLILCMMWEDAWAHELNVMDRGDGQNNIRTKWGPYIRTLPTSFDTPMFWNAAELEELRGTAVIDKIGRDEAERAFSEQLIPAINTSPALFPSSHHSKWYTLDAYHRAGSRILSRSFTVNRSTDDDDEAGGKESNGGEVEDLDSKIATESSVPVDDVDSLFNDTNEALESESESDDDLDPSDIAMVPMADLLNARWGSENAKLFYEPVILRMVATRNIKQGEQIFNTYGDPPNSVLLRRYGHVDLVQLSATTSLMPDIHGDVEMKDGDADTENIKCLGNPSDVIEIRADLVVHVVQTTGLGLHAEDSRARIEWWLDEGEDDTFVLNLPELDSQLSAVLPPALLSLVRLLTLSKSGFEDARSKGKLPKGKLKKTDAKDTREVLEIVDKVLQQREGMYFGGSAEDDEHLLSTNKILDQRKRHAAIVRLGEKRILRNVRQTVRTALIGLSFVSGAGSRNEKNGMRRDHEGGNGGNELDSTLRKRAIIEGDRGRKKMRK